METKPMQGGCHCGAVRYEAGGAAYHRTVCHCTDCRGTSGAPAVGWFSVAAAGFRWLQGTPATYRSSGRATRQFCANCGTQLTYRMDGLEEVDVTIASLDDPAAVRPDDQTWTRSELPWMPSLATLPRHAKTRDNPE